MIFFRGGKAGQLALRLARPAKLWRARIPNLPHKSWPTGLRASPRSFLFILHFVLKKLSN